MNQAKIKIAIFDLTDCEGCELEFLALRKELLSRGHDFEIVNWRLVNETNSPGPFDVTFIEGSPITEHDIEVVKRARAVSGKIVTLGTCAALGGIQSMLGADSRTAELEAIYGKGYKTKSKPPKPVSYYINVDWEIPGCPVNLKELEKLLVAIFANKKYTAAQYPVCLDCKAAKNACLFLDDGFCLGPVTRGGCGAPCPEKGLRCYGCFGPVPGADLTALRKAAKNISDPEFENATKMFFTHTDEYKEYITKPKKKESK